MQDSHQDSQSKGSENAPDGSAEPRAEAPSLSHPPPKEASIAGVPPTPQRIAFAGLAFSLLSVLFAHRELFAIFPESRGVHPIESFFFDADTTIPILNFALCALVLAYRRHEISETLTQKPALTPGLIASGVGLGILFWANQSQQIDLQIDSLIWLFIGGGLLLGGFRLLERLLLPLALLWLARPLPPMLLHHLHEWLQRSTGNFAEMTLSPFAPVGRSGHLLYFGGKAFEVIEGCSGLRLEMTLLTATLVYVAFTSQSRRQSLGVILIAIVIGPLLNGLRVISIMLNPAAEVAQIHSAQGMVFISLGVVLVASLDRLLERRFWPPAAPGIVDSENSRQDGRGRGPHKFGLVCAIGLLAVGFSLAVPAAPPSVSPVWGLHEIGTELGPWKRSRTLKLERRFLGAVAFSNKLYREYEREDQSGLARVFVSADPPTRRDKSSFSQKTRVREAVSQVTESVRIRIPDPPYEGERLIQEIDGRRWLTLHYRVNAPSLVEASLRWYWAVDLMEPTPPDMVTVRIEVLMDEKNPARSLAQLNELERSVAQALKRADPRKVTPALLPDATS